METEQLEDKLIVGAKIKIGKNYASSFSFDDNLKEGNVIELIEGYFELDNGLYTTTESCPSIWNEKRKEFDSIYHLFGNELEGFKDNEIIN